MTSDVLGDVVSVVKVALKESGAARIVGGMTIQEHSALHKLEQAIASFLDEVGA